MIEVLPPIDHDGAAFGSLEDAPLLSKNASGNTTSPGSFLGRLFAGRSERPTRNKSQGPSRRPNLYGVLHGQMAKVEL